MNRQNESSAHAQLILQALGGDEVAAFEVAEGYFNGRPRYDLDEAVHYLKIADSKDYPPAINKMGVCHEMGHGLDWDYDLAINHYRDAADRGSADGLCNWAYMLAVGLGPKRDPKRALRILKHRQLEGNAIALRNIEVLEGGLPLKKLIHLAAQSYNLSNKSTQTGDLGAQTPLYFAPISVESPAEEPAQSTLDGAARPKLAHMGSHDISNDCKAHPLSSLQATPVLDAGQSPRDEAKTEETVRGASTLAGEKLSSSGPRPITTQFLQVQKNTTSNKQAQDNDAREVPSSPQSPQSGGRSLRDLPTYTDKPKIGLCILDLMCERSQTSYLCQRETPRQPETPILDVVWPPVSIKPSSLSPSPAAPIEAPAMGHRKGKVFLW